MNRSRPPYFERVRRENVDLWAMLEARPKAAGPWRQLFRQVQSPRHVLSELLQNADDAGASWARAELMDGEFRFSHDGEDFDAQSFDSLCGFGLSSKTRLHTVGFRGIGFKSVFSLGDHVDVLSPSISVRFASSRFTVPEWIDAPPLDGLTQFAVRVRDEALLERMNAEFQRWLGSPEALLFFLHLRRLEVADVTVLARRVAQGPCRGSEWYELEAGRTRRALLVRSKDEPAPQDVLEEIADERGEPSYDVPPCGVELVLGDLEAPGRLHCVLPTELQLGLPFAVNAPFVLDPSRERIKDPAQSPTNRWLLARIGDLASQAMIGWLGNGDLSMADRSDAYDLLPPCPRKDAQQLADECTQAVTDAIRAQVTSQPVLLVRDGSLQVRDDCLDWPSELDGLWDHETIAKGLGSSATSSIGREVPSKTRDRLAEWGLLVQLPSESIREWIARDDTIPTPGPEELHRLWRFVTRWLRLPAWQVGWENLHIIPPERPGPLLNRADSAMLPKAADALDVEDRTFLASLLPLPKSSWVEGLRRGAAAATPNTAPEERALAELTKQLRLLEPDSIDRALSRAASHLSANDATPDIWIRFGRIVAWVDAEAPDEMRFLCRDGQLRLASGRLLAPNPALEDVLPAEWADQHVLSDLYVARLDSISKRERWAGWVASERAHVNMGLLPREECTTFYWKSGLLNALAERGIGINAFPYQIQRCKLKDWDFDAELWSFWTERVAAGALAWHEVTGVLATVPQRQLEKAVTCRAYQVGSTGTEHLVYTLPPQPPAAWLRRLRALPSLADDRGSPALPSTLVRATAETAVLSGSVPFVSPALDSPENAWLLTLLGVQAGMVDVQGLASMLAEEAVKPVADLDRVYALLRAIDRTVARADESQVALLQERLNSAPLLPGVDGRFYPLPAVVQSEGADIPGPVPLAVAVRGLALWARLGMAREASSETAIGWLSGLDRRVRLDTESRAKVARVLARFPSQCLDADLWIAIDDSLRSIAEFKWIAFRTGSLPRLFDGIRAQVADGTMVNRSTLGSSSLGTLSDLAADLHFRVSRAVGQRPINVPTWVAPFCTLLLKSEGTEEVDEALSSLWRARWYQADHLSVEATVGGTPAGPASETEASLGDGAVIVVGKPAHHHTSLVGTLGRLFGDRHVRDALADCVGREPDWVDEYLRSHFIVSDASARALVEEAPAESETGKGEGHAHSVVVPPLVDEPKRPEVEVDRRPARRLHPSKAEIIATVLAGMGFRLDGDVWSDGQGSHVTMSSGMFVAEGEAADGSALRFWLADRGLEDGMVIAAEVWDLLQQARTGGWVIVPEAEDRYTPNRFDELEARVRVFPASFRLLPLLADGSSSE